jgi:hypothetical protein
MIHQRSGQDHSLLETRYILFMSDSMTSIF